MTGDKLNRFFSAMSPDQYELLVGMETSNPLTDSFVKKRVIHAGLSGRAIQAEEWQSTWKKLMHQSAPKGKRVAYVHIPFCLERCLYCGFFQNVSDNELETSYVDRLIAELQMNAYERYVTSGLVHAVFIGGGTPSTLSPYNAARLLQAIHSYLPLANDYELTMEARIHDLVPDKMEAWLENGVNRISIGVQSFNTYVRQAVGRLDAKEVILERLQQLSNYEQAAVIIDLMYGLPQQNWDVWLDDLALLSTAAIDGWDLYQLNIYETSALKRAIETGRLPPAASTGEQARMFAAAEAILADNVFARISVCHWAKSNRERNMYNTLTKNGNAILPFGCGAGGSIDGVSLSLERNLARYMSSIDKGEKPIMGMRQPHAVHGLQNAILGQLKQGYVAIKPLAAQYGTDVMEIEPLLKLWEARGLVHFGTTAARLTVAGQFWYMNIAQSILECLNALITGEQAVQAQMSF